MVYKNILTLDKRTAIVTGGSKGIGLAIATKLAASGMNVAILSKTADSAKNKSDELNQMGFNTIGLQCDITSANEIMIALSEIYEKFGSIDVLVNNAGILDLMSIEKMDMDNWDNVMNINLKGTFLMVQKTIPYLENSKYPRIINISSNSGRMGGFSNGMAYSASKGGVIALTYGLARQLANKGITVNCIAPGTIETEMLNARDEETKKNLLLRFPLGRFGKPEEVAAAVCYFASEEAGFTTGSVLDVNGGLFMG